MFTKQPNTTALKEHHTFRLAEFAMHKKKQTSSGSKNAAHLAIML
jgi:hypothetical protein